jgi:hypothetical protein
LEETRPGRPATGGRRALPGRYACKPCFKKHSCDDCKKFDLNGLAGHGNKRLCNLCADKHLDAEREKAEKWDDGDLPIHGSMKVPSLPERPSRLISIEMELDGDSGLLARTLYRCGIIARPRVEDYHAYSDRSMKHLGFLKYDGTASAGELILFLLDLDDPVHAKSLLEALSRVRGLLNMGKVSHGVTNGGHKHIDAHNFTYSDAWRLVTIWNYLEDPIFRLAGAGSSYGHRSLDPRSARPNHGGGYSNPVAKGPWGTQSAFGLSIQQQDRHCGLNFQNYLQAKNNCACGDMLYGDGSACTCNLGKATIEWRVWNSTSHPRIMHAWIAFMQATHAYAQQEKKMARAEEDRFPAMPWDRRKFKTLSASELDAWRERIEWVHRNLPLLPEERDSIVYALKQSEVASVLGNQYLDSLLTIENKHGLLAKVAGARNPSRRERKIQIKLPTPGDPEDSSLEVPFRTRSQVVRTFQR